jgi:hypothetical protein
MIAGAGFSRYTPGMDVKVITVDGEKWVTSESLQDACGNRERPDRWLRKKKRDLIENADYKKFDNGLLFSFKSAVKIFEAARAQKPALPKTKRGRQSYPLDEYGLPVLPPEKRKGPLINPYRI